MKIKYKTKLHDVMHSGGYDKIIFFEREEGVLTWSNVSSSYECDIAWNAANGDRLYPFLQLSRVTYHDMSHSELRRLLNCIEETGDTEKFFYPDPI